MLMYVFLALLGLYLLLSLPFLGHHLRHGVLHVLIHLFQHHERTAVAFCGVAWALLGTLPVFLLLTWWWAAADVVILLLSLTKLFGTFSSKH